MTSYTLYLVVAMLAIAQSAPQLSSKDAVIVLQENDFNGIDPWHWRYETSDGTYHEQQGAEADGVMVQGRYSWTPPDAGGAVYDVSYTAGANGYVAKVSIGTSSAQRMPLPLPGAATFRSGEAGGPENLSPPSSRPNILRIGVNSQLSLIG